MEHNHKRDQIPFGSDFKLVVTVTNLGDGLHLSDDSVALTCILEVLDTSAEFQKSGMKKLDDDNYVIPVDSSVLAKGDVFLTTKISVPDADFFDNTRDEINKVDTGVTII